MKSNLIESIKLRRSIYNLNNQSTISDQQLIDQIKAITQFVPSPFNIQSGRVVILLGENHHKLWNIVLETLRKIVPAANFASTENKIKSFDAGYGTILFFDDTPSVEDLKANFRFINNTLTVGPTKQTACCSLRFGLISRNITWEHRFNTIIR